MPKTPPVLIKLILKGSAPPRNMATEKSHFTHLPKIIFQKSFPDKCRKITGTQFRPDDTVFFFQSSLQISSQSISRLAKISADKFLMIKV